MSTSCSSAIGIENGARIFRRFWIGRWHYMDESDLWCYTNYKSTELVISDIMTDEEICSINKSEESPVLESIPATEAGEVEITFAEESIIKRMTIDHWSKAAESSKRKKYQCERCGITYVRWNVYQNHISGN